MCVEDAEEARFCERVAAIARLARHLGQAQGFIPSPTLAQRVLIFVHKDYSLDSHPLPCEVEQIQTCNFWEDFHEIQTVAS